MLRCLNIVYTEFKVEIGKIILCNFIQSYRAPSNMLRLIRKH